MPERKYDTRTMFRQIHRDLVENNLGLAQILDYFGLPQISREQIEKALAEEGVTRPVTSSPAAKGHRSTSELPIHRSPRTTLPIRDGEPR